MPALPPQYKFQMPQRASTQLSINLQQSPMRANLNKNFGSSHDLKSAEIKSIERRQEKSREVKKGRAPPPPLTSQSNNRIKVKFWHVLHSTGFFNSYFNETFRWRHHQQCKLLNHLCRKLKPRHLECSATLWPKIIKIPLEAFNLCQRENLLPNQKKMVNQWCQSWFHHQPTRRQFQRLIPFRIFDEREHSTWVWCKPRVRKSLGQNSHRNFNAKSLMNLRDQRKLAKCQLKKDIEQIFWTELQLLLVFSLSFIVPQKWDDR